MALIGGPSSGLRKEEDEADDLEPVDLGDRLEAL
jgi:hypothetical protein